MNSNEAERILLALDGITANIETLRSLIEGNIEEDAPIVRDGKCLHPKTREIQTLGTTVMFCDDCGYQL